MGESEDSIENATMITISNQGFIVKDSLRLFEINGNESNTFLLALRERMRSALEECNAYPNEMQEMWFKSGF